MTVRGLHRHVHLDLADPVLFHVRAELHLVHPGSVHVESEDRRVFVGLVAGEEEGVGTKTPAMPF